MRILALETTDKTGSVAALDDCNILAQLMLDQNQRSAQSLAPAMKTLLEQVQWQPKDVQLVGVSVGPGSFTGLRVGVTTAKVFAYAVGADVLGINTLEAIALGGASGLIECCDGKAANNSRGLTAPGVETHHAERWGGSCTAAPGQQCNCRPNDEPKTGCRPVLHAALDAQRGDVVAQSFAVHSPERVESLGPQELLPAEQWLARLAPGSVVSGPALIRLTDRLPPGIVALDRVVWSPRASAVGRLAAQYYAAGRRDDLWKLVPRYCRRSAAEEKWEAMGK